MSKEIVSLKDIKKDLNIHHEEWTEDVEYILEKMRINCVNLSDYHRKRYHHYEGYLKYFRIPVIILSAMNSVFAVGLQPYIDQASISITNCLLSMICGIITSIELYLSIQSNMENELSASKDFYILGVDIYKTLNLNRENRGGNPRSYLDEKHAQYCKLIETSNILVKKIKDALAPIPPKLFDIDGMSSPYTRLSNNKLDKISESQSSISSDDDIEKTKKSLKKKPKNDDNKKNIFNNFNLVVKDNIEDQIGQFYLNASLWFIKKTSDETLYYLMDRTGHTQWDDPREYGIIDYHHYHKENKSNILEKASNIIKTITKKEQPKKLYEIKESTSKKSTKEPSIIHTEYEESFESDNSD